MNKLLIVLFYSLLFSSITLADEQRCLAHSAETTAPSVRFEQRGDEAVFDNKTQLIWKACPETIEQDECGTALRTFTWAEALDYVAKLSRQKQQQPWRLPNIRELASLVELQCHDPAVNLSVFPTLTSQPVWSSSPYHFYTHYAWYVDFTTGATTYDERIAKKGLWLVADLSDG